MLARYVKKRFLAALAAMLLRPVQDAKTGSPCLPTSFNARLTISPIVLSKYQRLTKTASFGVKPANLDSSKAGKTIYPILKAQTLQDAKSYVQSSTKAVQNAELTDQLALNAKVD